MFNGAINFGCDPNFHPSLACQNFTSPPPALGCRISTKLPLALALLECSFAANTPGSTSNLIRSLLGTETTRSLKAQQA